MIPSDATRIVGYLAAGFPGRIALDAESLEVYTREIAILADHLIGFEAAQQIVREAQRFPTIKEFRATYHAVMRRKAGDRAESHGLPQSSGREVPEWVHVWWWCRHSRETRELRSFPQQREANADEPFLSDEDYTRLLAEWIASGSPRLGSLGALVGVVATETRRSPEEVRELLADEDPEPGSASWREKREPANT